MPLRLLPTLTYDRRILCEVFQLKSTENAAARNGFLESKQSKANAERERVQMIDKSFIDCEIDRNVVAKSKRLRIPDKVMQRELTLCLATRQSKQENTDSRRSLSLREVDGQSDDRTAILRHRLLLCWAEKQLLPPLKF